MIKSGTHSYLFALHIQISCVFCYPINSVVIAVLINNWVNKQIHLLIKVLYIFKKF